MGPKPLRLMQWGVLGITLLAAWVSVNTYLMTAGRGEKVKGGVQMQHSSGLVLPGGDMELEAMRRKIRANMAELRSTTSSSAPRTTLEPTPTQPTQHEDTEENTANSLNDATDPSDSMENEEKLPSSSSSTTTSSSSSRKDRFPRSADTSIDILMKHRVHTITFNVTKKEVLEVKPGCAVPNVNGFPKGNKMLHSHKKQRKGEYTPHEYAERMHTIATQNEIPGFEVEIIQGTSIPVSVNSIPRLDDHDGKYNVYKKWGDTSLWKDLRFLKVIPDVLQPGKTYNLPNYMKAQPPMWAAKIPNAWVNQGNVYTCTHAFTTGACLWEMPAIRPLAGKDKNYKSIAAICDSWCRGYFHFTHEHLPRFASIYSILKNDPSIVITAPGNREFVKQYISEVLGLKNRLIGSGTAFAEEVIYPQPSTCGNMWTHSLILLRKIVFTLHELHHVLPEEREGALAAEDAAGKTESKKWLVVLAERAGGKSGKSRNPTNYEELRERLITKYEGTIDFVSSLNKVWNPQKRGVLRCTVVGCISTFFRFSVNIEDCIVNRSGFFRRLSIQQKANLCTEPILG